MNEEEKDGDGNLDTDKDNGKDEEDENENEEEEEEQEEEEAEETPLFPRQPGLTNVAARFDRERLVREGRGKKNQRLFPPTSRSSYQPRQGTNMSRPSLEISLRPCTNSKAFARQILLPSSQDIQEKK